MLYRVARNALAVLLTLLLPEIGRAQPTSESTVTGHGEVTIRPLPTALRVSRQINASGGSVEAALKRLAQRRQAAVKKLEELQADSASISFSRPGVFESSRILPSPPGASYPPATAPDYPIPPTAPSPAAVPPTVYPAPAPPATVPPATVPPVSTSPTHRAAPAPPSAPPSAPPPVTTSPTVRAGATPSTAPSPTATPLFIPRPAAPPYPEPPRTAPGSPPRLPPIQPVVHVWTIVTADWPLTGEGFDERLIAGEALMTKIAAADVAGATIPDPLIPRDGDVDELMPTPPRSYPPRVAPPSRYSAPSYTPPGMTPDNGSYWSPVSFPPAAPASQRNYRYVTKITESQRKAAMAEAFAKARREAGELAGAAGKSIGGLLSLRGNACSGANPNEEEDVEPQQIEVTYGITAVFRLP